MSTHSIIVGCFGPRKSHPARPRQRAGAAAAALRRGSRRSPKLRCSIARRGPAGQRVEAPVKAGPGWASRAGSARPLALKPGHLVPERLLERAIARDRRPGAQPESKGPRNQIKPSSGLTGVANIRAELIPYIGGRAAADAANFARVVAEVVAKYMGCWNEDAFKKLPEQVSLARAVAFVEAGGPLP